MLQNPKEARKNNDNQAGLVKLPKGDYLIRFTTYKYEKSVPFRELHFHYGVGKKSILCPKRMYDENCPICDFAFDIWNNYKASGDESLKETFKAIMPKMRIYAPILVKQSSINQDVVNLKEIKFWGMSQKTYEEVINEIVAADAEGVDVTDPKNGLDFVIKMDTTMGRNDRFQVKSIKSARKPTPLVVGTAKDIESILDTCPNIEDIFKPTSTKEIEEALEIFVDPRKAENDDRKIDSPKKGSVKDFSLFKADRDVDAEIDKKFKMLEDEAEKESEA